MARWREAAIGGRDDLRPVREEALHVTLVFLGPRPAEVVGPLWDVAAAAARGRRAARLTPQGVNAIPGRRPRLFALDLADEGGCAADLQRAVAGALTGDGLHQPEARPFWPHVTLARVRRGARAESWSPEKPLPGPFTSRSLTLYESRPSPAGARYRALERLELAA